MHSLLVVGGSSEIGRAIVRSVDRPDLLVVAHYRGSRAQLDALASEVRAQVVPIQADLADEGGCDGFLKQADAVIDAPDGIVLLPAARLTFARFKDLAWAAFQEQLDLQLAASVRLLQHYLPGMARRRSGKVVFVSSSCTVGVPPAGMAHYVAAKHAQLGLMKALAAEFGGRHVCINAVSPSMVETGFLRDLPEPLVARSAERHPLGRNADPTDVAPAVAFLLSDRAGYINGVNLPIAGGLVA